MTSNTPRTDPGTQTVCLAVPLLPGTTSTDRDHLRAVHGLDLADGMAVPEQILDFHG